MRHRIRTWMCDTMGWHSAGDDTWGFDGASFSDHCKYCGRAVLMDSQGGWFAIEKERSWP